jgi:hypothetical protein
MKRLSRTAGATLALACACWLGNANAQSINTIPAWNGTSFISSFGVPNTATYGQTVTVGSNSHNFYGFSFRVSVQSGGPITLRGLVSVWDTATNRVVGAPLYQSGPVTISGSSYAPVNFTFPTPISVTPGQTLVLYTTTSLDLPQPNSAARWGALTNNTTYPGGQFVFLNNGPDTSQWANVAWATISEDLAFTASFDGDQVAIPTLSEWSLIGLSSLLAMLGIARMRRRRQR